MGAPAELQPLIGSTLHTTRIIITKCAARLQRTATCQQLQQQQAARSSTSLMAARPQPAHCCSCNSSTRRIIRAAAAARPRRHTAASATAAGSSAPAPLDADGVRRYVAATPALSDLLGPPAGLQVQELLDGVINVVWAGECRQRHSQLLLAGAQRTTRPDATLAARLLRL